MFCKGLSPAEYCVDQTTLRSDIFHILKGDMEIDDICLIKKNQDEIITEKLVSRQVVHCKCRSSIAGGLKQCKKCNECFHLDCMFLIDEKCNSCQLEEKVNNFSSTESDQEFSSDSECSFEKEKDRADTPQESGRVEYFTTKHGNAGVSYNGFCYTLKRRNKFNDVYICRGRNCKSQIKVFEGCVDEDEDIHEHPEDHLYVLRRECLNLMINRCKDSLDPIIAIYDECLRELHLKSTEAASEFSQFK